MSNRKAPAARLESQVYVKFTRTEAEQLKKLCAREDRSAGNACHWIIRRYLAGELADVKLTAR